MPEPLTGYEANSVSDVESFLDDNPAASSDEVYLGTVGHSERAIAAVAAKRAGSGGGGSTPFNGGTITNPLTILETDGTSEGIVINTQGGFGVNAFAIAAPHTTLSVDGDGVVTIGSDDTLGVSFQGGLTDASLAVSGAGSEVDVGTQSGVRVADANRRFQAGYGTPGIFVFSYLAAPADANLDAGECALWFDQTNGAAKLMVKAKTANGTVVTGELPLA